jgi:hypothetical protein
LLFAVVQLNDTVRVTHDTAAIEAGAEGIVIGWYTHSDDVLVRFAGGTVAVARDALVVVRRPDPGASGR